MNKKYIAPNVNQPLPNPQKLQRQRGRPRATTFRQRFQVTIPPSVAEKLIQLGNGSLSHGIEILASTQSAQK